MTTARRQLSIAAFSLALAGSVFVAGAESFPAGDYEAGGATLSFAGGAYRVLQGDKAMVEGTYTIDGAKLVLTDVSGPYACPAASKTGTYTWRFDGKALVLTKVDDACDDRSGDLNGHPWTKR